MPTFEDLLTDAQRRAAAAGVGPTDRQLALLGLAMDMLVQRVLQLEADLAVVVGALTKLLPPSPP